MPKRKQIPLRTKVEIIHKYNDGVSQVQLSEEYGLAKTTVSTVIHQKDKILSEHEGNRVELDKNSKKVRKRMRHAAHPNLEEALFKWFNQIRGKNVPVSGPTLIERANQLAVELKIENFKASAGWIHRFKLRHNIVQRAVSGESESVIPDTVTQWIDHVLPDIIKSYSPKDIFNADESGLFFRMMPDRTLHVRGEPCHGTKQSKERITVMFCANMDGSEKYPLTVVGKFANPRCFKGTKSLPVNYVAQKRAWMDTELFYRWLREFDRKFHRQERKVLLMVDNVACHKDDVTLKATTLKFFPPNTTSKLQPMDQGVIKNCKVFYRHRFIKKLAAELDAGGTVDLKSQITLKDGIEMLSSAWGDVKAETIANCFRKAGFRFTKPLAPDDEVVQVENEEDVPLVTRNLWDFVSKEFDLTEVDFMEYVDIDRALETSGDLSLAEIAASVSSEPCTGGENSDDDDPEPEIPTARDAWTAFKTVKKFLLNQDFDAAIVTKIEDRILNEVVEKQKQTKITDFFSK